MLSSLQESGLTGVVLKSLIMKDVSVCYFLYSAFNDQDRHVYAIRSCYIQYFKYLKKGTVLFQSKYTW